MISLVLACDLDGAIGKAGGLPWGPPIPADMRQFRRLTRGHTVIMGRATFESLGRKPLPGRANVVASTTLSPSAVAGIQVIRDLIEPLRLHVLFDNQMGETFVIGGAEVFRQAYPFAAKVYLTLVHGRYGGDRFFPLDLLLGGEDGWREVRREEVRGELFSFHGGPRHQNRNASPDLTFLDYERDPVGIGEGRG